MNQLEKITASRDLCERLVELKILPTSFIWHLAEDDQEAIEEAKIKGEVLSETPIKWDTCLLSSPEYFPGGCIPAWTKTEIDVMIGPNYAKPDLFTPKQLGQSKVQVAETYPVFFPDKMLVYENGASASAAGLIFLLEKKHVTAEDANYRYQKVFK